MGVVVKTSLPARQRDAHLPKQRIEKVPAAPATPPKSPLDQAIDAVVVGRNSDPFALLGPHQIDTPSGRRWVIRAFHPGATSAAIRFSDSRPAIEAAKLRPEGFFEATLPEEQQDRPSAASYRIQYKFPSGATKEQYNTYAFPFLLSKLDLYLFDEGAPSETSTTLIS